MVLVKVEFVGTLRGTVGRKRHEIMLDDPATVGMLLKKLNDSLKLKSGSLMDGESTNPRSDILILVNGKEVSVLDGLTTKLEERASVALIPVSHGG